MVSKLRQITIPIRNNWVVFKLLVRLFLLDWVGIGVIFGLPLLISFIYLFLFQKGIFDESFFQASWLYNLGYIDKIKIWYELLLYTVGLIAFVYLAVQIANLKKTILFKKLITGFTTPVSLLMLLFGLYFVIAVSQVASKMAILAFYPNFRNVIAQRTDWLWMTISLVLFIITNLSLGLLFGSIRGRGKIIAWLALAVFFGLLFFAGLSFAPSDIEGLFFIDIDNMRYLNYGNIDKHAYNWRLWSFISPFQPSLKMMEASSNYIASLVTISHYQTKFSDDFAKFISLNERQLSHPSLLRGDWLWNNDLPWLKMYPSLWIRFADWEGWQQNNQDWANYWNNWIPAPIETTAIIGVESGDNYQPIWDEQIKRKLTPPNVLFGNLDEFKAALETKRGVAKWMGYFEKLRENDEFYPKGKGILRLNQEDFNILKRDLEDFVRGYRDGTIAIQEEPNKIVKRLIGNNYLVVDSKYVKFIGKFISNRFEIFVRRPGVYNNYFLPLVINLGWVAIINGINFLIWKRQHNLC